MRNGGGGILSEYTEAEHAENLLFILSLASPCQQCPDMGFIERPNTCIVCHDFISLKYHYNGCPCKILGSHESIKRTWLALEEKGYI